MAFLDVSSISSWHAHVYFDSESRDQAATFRDVVAAELGSRVQIGRFTSGRSDRIRAGVSSLRSRRRNFPMS